MEFRIAIITVFFSSTCLFVLCKPQPKKIPADEKKKVSISDSALLDIVERQTFQYFWNGAEPHSGMARERFHEDNPAYDKEVIASGGSGFGIMSILAAVHRNFVSRDSARERLERMVHFLETADRFHGAWPHWWNGETGKVRPFGKKDDGGDLVETSYLLQGLLCARQFFKDGNQQEKD
ncbi:MAG TPA: beta-glucosidase, partial [Chitinophagaceae bacterium]|nr:beta-glucosidase [Chitinophagaceae bacterium]